MYEWYSGSSPTLEIIKLDPKQITVKFVLSGHSERRPKIGFQDQLSLIAGLLEHSAILLTFIKLPCVFKTFVLSNFEWPLKTGFTVKHTYMGHVARNPDFVVCKQQQRHRPVINLHSLISARKVFLK